MRKLALFLAVAALVLVAPNVAKADLVLFLLDGDGNSVTVTDGLDGALDGVVVFNGALGGGAWTVNITGGISKPNIGPAELDLVSANVNGNGLGVLLIGLTDTDYTGSGGPGTVRADIGGTTEGTVTYFAGYDNANLEFGVTDFAAFDETFASGAFSDTFNLAAVLSDPFSLTQFVIIDHGGSGVAKVTSFDAHLRVVPEPGTMLLLGLGFLTLGLTRRIAGR